MLTFPVYGRASLWLLLLSALLSPSFAQSDLPLPLPNGAYNTTVTAMELVDHARLEPYSNITEPRAVMISYFRPVECEADHLADYSPPATAAHSDEYLSSAGITKGSFARFKLQVCSDQSTRSSDGCEDDLPVVIFSPGLRSLRSWSNGVAQWVASHGYHVVSIDHPYDASFVEFPDGRQVYGTVNSITPETMAKAAKTRQEDSKFVLDQLGEASVIRKLNPGATDGLDVRRSAIFGHSLGGSNAANVLLDDPRMMGGINFDGTVYGPGLDTDETRPFMLFGTGVHNATNDSSWSTFWSHLKGWKRGMVYQPAEHLTFTDEPMLLKLLDIDLDDIPSDVDLQIGTVDGLRNMEILSAYIVAFLDFVLKGGEEGILSGPTSKHPEIAYNLF